MIGLTRVQNAILSWEDHLNLLNGVAINILYQSMEHIADSFKINLINKLHQSIDIEHVRFIQEVLISVYII